MTGVCSGSGWVSSGYVRGDGNEGQVPWRPRLDTVRRPAVRPLRREHLVCRVNAEGQAPSSSTSARACAPTVNSSGGHTPFHGTVLLTHLHWDHVQGLPFFVPLHIAESSLDIYGPRQDEGPLGEVFTGPDAAAVLPDHARAARGRRPLPRHRRRRLPGRPREGAVALGPSRRPDARLPRRAGTACRSRTSPTTAPAAATTPTTSSRRSARALRRRRLLIHDAQHTARSSARSGTGVTARRLRGARRHASRVPGRSRSYHHDPAHGDDPVDAIASCGRATSRRASAAPK